MVSSGEGEWGLGRLHKGEGLAEAQTLRQSYSGEGGGVTSQRAER